MLNTKSKKLCLVKSNVEIKGLTKDKVYKVISKTFNCICIYNDLGIKFYYNKRYFREVRK